MIEQASLVIGEGNWAVKSDSLLGYKINNGKYYPREMSVVRATTGTRINEDGLVELVPYNLNSYSENFTLSWGTDGTSTATNNFTTAPNGTQTAAKVVANFANGYAYKSLPVAVGTYTLSFYVKASAPTTISVDFNDIGAGVFGQVFNLTTEWQRVSFTHNVTVGSNLYISYSGLQLGVEYYIWGAQLVEGSVAKDYLPTTDRLDVARIDYSSGSAALLVEPQRTNIATYSEQFDNAAWTKYQATITANAATAPNGVVNADKFTDNTNNDIHATYAAYLISSATTISGYVKSAEYSRVSISNLSDGGDVIFNLSNGTVVSTPSNFVNAQIESLSNGWYRISATTNGTSGAKAIGFCLVNNSNQTSFVGTGTSGAYFWGAQLEVGSYATSYIPTQGSTVTRNADVISKTGIADLIGTEFTVFLDAYESFGASTRYLVLKGSGGTYANAVLLEANSSNQIALTVLNNSSATVFGALSSALTSGQRFKLAVRCKNNDFAFYVNGTQVSVQTSGSVPTTSDLYLGYYSDYSDNYNTINSAVIYKTALTNAQLATLTTI